jgi:hypothetical protein
LRTEVGLQSRPGLVPLCKHDVPICGFHSRPDRRPFVTPRIDPTVIHPAAPHHPSRRSRRDSPTLYLAPSRNQGGVAIGFERLRERKACRLSWQYASAGT